MSERITQLPSYVVLVAGATAVGPLLASFIIEYSPETWHTFSWVCAGIAGFNLLAVYFLYPESSFVRPVHYEVSMAPDEKNINKETHVECLPEVEAGLLHVDPVPVQWIKVWTSIWSVNKDASTIRAFAQPFVFLLYPNVLWAVFMYGCSLASQIIMIFAFPSLLMAPPYLFSGIGVGLMQVAALIGIVIATFAGGYLSDIITAHRIRKAGGTVWPEQRLISLIPGCWIPPAGCILVACACGYKLHWVAIAFGFGMLSFGTVYGPNIALTYVVESHPEFASDTLVVINVFKNIVAFIFLYVAVEWVKDEGWIQVYMIMFMLMTLSYLLAIPVYYYGERLRKRSQKFVFRDRDSD
ncbi:hypothetical protein E4T39_05703 [Aureobasidium subglaciale]|nr:hypothetical protein E4T39_05703 [Aureobasidium subglaciale]